MPCITLDNCTNAARELAALFAREREWICVEQTSATSALNFALTSSDCELFTAQNHVLLSIWNERGNRTFRVHAWTLNENQITLDATRRTQDVQLIFKPRASFTVAREDAHAARLRACSTLAATVQNFLGSRFQIQEIALSRAARRDEQGKYARIRFQDARLRAHVAVTCDLTATTANQGIASASPDAFLTSALQWLLKLNASKTKSTSSIRLYLVAASRTRADELATRRALLCDSVKTPIEIFITDDSLTELAPAAQPSLDELLDELRQPPHEVSLDETSSHQTPEHQTREHLATTFNRTSSTLRAPSALAQFIIAFAPEAIDSIRARKGETLRYHGLPFARIRRVMHRTHLWLGFALANLTLAPKLARSFQHFTLEDEHSLTDEVHVALDKILRELKTHRTHETGANRAHALYRAASESWLESLVRRDVTRLDAGLKLAPLHLQLRLSAAKSPVRPLDLLAVRRDGRLVVIELKVAEDTALPLQAADYWRRVECLRRAHRLDDLFDGMKVLDAPPLVYAVAPGLRFARSFEQLARLLDSSIELYRLDINEDWRAGLRVQRRTKI